MKTILTEFRNGWNWPRNWNKNCRAKGYQFALISEPEHTITRLRMAFGYAWDATREALANWIKP